MSSRAYMAKYVHRISPRPDDVDGPFELSDNAFSNKTALAKAMRKAGILHSGERVREMRVEGDKTVVLLGRPSPWHAIVLTEGAYNAPGVDYPGYNRTKTASLRRVTKRSTPKRKRARRKIARTRLRRRISRRRRTMSLPKTTRDPYKRLLAEMRGLYERGDQQGVVDLAIREIDLIPGFTRDELYHMPAYQASRLVIEDLARKVRWAG